MKLSVILLFSLVPFSATYGDDKPASRNDVVLTDVARRIHQEAFVVDGHNDLPWRFREKKDLALVRHDLTKPVQDFHTDIPRLKAGNMGLQFWSAYVDAKRAKDMTAVRATLEQIDVIQRLIKKYPDVFEQAFTHADVLRIRQVGRIASMIGVEGGHSIDNSLGVLRVFHGLGVRYMTLTHSDTLDWADSATDKPKNNGLSPFGELVVLEMNRLGMMVDISHVSADTMRHVLRITRAPVIASHSSAFALAEHPRNVPDDVLKLVARNRGVVMVNFFPGFIVPEGARRMMNMFESVRKLQQQYPNEQEFQSAFNAWKKENPIPRGSVHTVVDHIEHIIKVAGVDHVGLGSDFDGIGTTPRQLEDVSCYPFITQELLNRGYKREDIHKILGGNALRVLKECEETAAKLSKLPVTTATGPARNP